ncbi:hypothetical protein TCAL_11360 [Tigriopus californicus]|uniref:Transcription initiation factor TFIID subunit 12 n=1 Tax=Tigriopus californicus TaxID=6832 RepID=A0A553PHW5_TIGCA|nr:transcription initiation factor TFIID subunit 12-like [Tigriopus californicus]TRY77278.1 hypothetical protein TCAL_11360 [Tigriopus californicus]
MSHPTVSLGLNPSGGPTAVVSAPPIAVNGASIVGLDAGSGASGSSGATTTPSPAGGAPSAQILDKHRLNELVKEVDVHEQLDEDVEDLLLHIADDFIEQTVTASCALARHRKAPAIEVRDVQMVLERNWNMYIPGFGTEDIRQHKRSALNESHKSRMALIRKTMKKY